MSIRLVVGVGNINASEALFRTRVRPRREARSLSRHEAACLARSVRSVPGPRSGSGGTTLWDPVRAGGSAGYFDRSSMVYERAGKACRRCGTPVKRLTQGRRSTYYCPTCPK
jgi:formamidopyrimidine-DNA glycosylase